MTSDFKKYLKQLKKEEPEIYRSLMSFKVSSTMARTKFKRKSFIGLEDLVKDFEKG